MGRIRVLDDTLANQIAAGEVVERPASAAKELLENALDAGASHITCEIADGGVGKLRVVDDGHGMSPEDAELALQRHATSKLRSAKDLHRIMTLGFRGEALPSIASVSRFTLRTREPEAVGAVRIRVEGGQVVGVGEVGGPPGTEVLVEDLFFNIPARRKFLRKPATESSHILEVVQRMALSHPEVAFRFVRDGRVTLDVPRGQSLAGRARAVFGPRVTEGLVPMRYDLGQGYTVDGLIGPPSHARATPRHYHTFLNGRYVRDRVMMSAVQSAYGQRLERGRHPFVVLRIQAPPEAVDVNVHPAKTEVRFVDSQQIHRLIARGVDAALAEEPWRPGDAEPQGRRYTLTAPATRPPGSASAPGEGSPGGAERSPSTGLDAHRRRVFDAMERLGAKRRGLGRPVTPPPPVHARPAGDPAPLKLTPTPTPAGRDRPPAPQTGLAHARQLTDLSLERLVFTGLVGAGWAAYRAVDGIVLVDVQAARTRLAYDRLRAGAPGRPLTPPSPVALPGLEQAQIPARAQGLAALGLEVESLGRGSWAVTRLPAGLPPAAAGAALSAALAEADDLEAMALALAGLVARRAGAPTAAEAAGWPQAIGEAQHQPQRSVPWLVALTDDELGRRRTEDRLK